jgi:hypothetical protein
VKPTERRPDGWPLCPICGNDELAVLETPPPPDWNEPISWYLARDMHCYWCCRVTVLAGEAAL